MCCYGLRVIAHEATENGAKVTQPVDGMITERVGYSRCDEGRHSQTYLVSTTALYWAG